MGGRTKLKLTIAAIGVLVLAAVGFFFLRITDAGLWIAWIGALMGLVTQYSVANAVITNKALGGNGRASPPVG